MGALKELNMFEDQETNVLRMDQEWEWSIVEASEELEILDDDTDIAFKDIENLLSESKKQIQDLLETKIAFVIK